MSKLNKEIMQIMNCFPNSVLNSRFELIIHEKTNTYICLDDCETKLDIQCKVLKWLSRPIFKTRLYKTDKKNYEYQKFMWQGFNKYLGTNFSLEEITLIYEKLGNSINHKLTVKFIESDFDLEVLEGE